MSQPAPPAWRVHTHQTLASTQQAAIEAAHAGDPGRLAILAKIQTEGRGSRGRAWASAPGNLYASLLIRPQTPIQTGHYALLAGIALHDALAPYAENLMLKWPNDLLLNGAKLGGILIDAAMTPQNTLDWLVIGIGANLKTAPHIAGRATACLKPPPPEPEDVLTSLLAAIDHHMGANNIPEKWLKNAHPPGTHLDIRTPTRHIKGVFETITAQGALKLQNIAEPIASGDVFLGRVA
jgi:BirA family biotin operon repressor/biotin-[acetyl-CoA-carboxylase] ligase